MKNARKGPLHIQLLGRTRNDQPCGIRAALPHLPVDLWRLPGETVDQMAHRALQMATGQGLVVALLIYADSPPLIAPAAPLPPAAGPPAACQVRVRNDRGIAVVCSRQLSQLSNGAIEVG